MMKQMIPATILSLAFFAGSASAGEYVDLADPSPNAGEVLVEGSMQAQPYRVKVSCDESGSCTTVLGAFNTGFWTFKDGDECRKVTVELDKMRTQAVGESEVIDLPSLNKTSETVACPTPL